MNYMQGPLSAAVTYPRRRKSPARRVQYPLQKLPGRYVRSSRPL